MKFFPVRYWWTDHTGEKTATTVASGSTEAEALRRFKSENPHLNNAVIVVRPKKEHKP